MNEQRSLYTAITAQDLTDTEAAALRAFFLKGTHSGSRTNRTLSNYTTGRFMRLPTCGILRRVLLTAEGVDYCAGQDYPGEVRYIRDYIVNH